MYFSIHDKYSSTSSKQRLWHRNGINITNLLPQKTEWQRGAVVKESLARAHKLGSTPGKPVF